MLNILLAYCMAKYIGSSYPLRASVSEVSSALGNVETGGRQPLSEALREATDLLLIRVV